MCGADNGLDLPELRPLPAEPATAGGRDGLALRDPLLLAEPCFVPRELLPILVRFDGTHAPAAVAAAASRELRQRVPVAAVDALVRDLDARLLLVTPRFRAARDDALAHFLATGVRAASHAGSPGYPADPAALRRELAAVLASAPPVPVHAASSALCGLVAPHIDLARGRTGYAAAYARLRAAAPADLYVIFGTGHDGPSAPITGLPIDWQTPLGTAVTDRTFVAAVHAAIGPAAPENLLLHRGEHSLEFQVLWLQYVHECAGWPPPRVAGFLCGALPSADGDPSAEPWLQQTVQALRGAAGARRVAWIAGADLAHLGRLFGDDAAVDAELLQQLDARDRARLQRLAQGEPGPFHCAVEHGGNPDRVCSAPAIALCALLAGGRAELLHYGQAAASDGSQVVSFCAAAFASTSTR